MKRWTSPSVGVLAFVSLFAVATLCAHSAPRVAEPHIPLALEDVFRLEIASDPQLAADGRRVLYVRRHADITTDTRRSEVWVIDVDARSPAPVAVRVGDASMPRWAPDGTRFAVVVDGEADGPTLRLIDSTTLKAVAAVRLPSSPRDIAWSPSGRYLAFSGSVPTREPVVEGLLQPPPGAVWKDPPRVIDRVYHRVDAVGYVPPSRPALFLVDTNSGGVERLTDDEFAVGEQWTGMQFDWTPDGAEIIVSVTRGPDYWRDVWNSDLFSIDVRERTLKQLTTRPGPDDRPAVSPDGRQIAYLGWDDRSEWYMAWHLYLMNRDGTGARRLSPDLDRSVVRVAWAPDGNSLYGLMEDEGSTRLVRFRMDGTYEEISSQVGGDGSAYGRGEISVAARSGHVAFTHATSQIPSQIAISDDKKRVRVLTRLNSGWISKRALADVEELRFPSSRDGREIHGWLVKPPDFDPTRQYPLVVQLHGGQSSHYGPQFDVEMQLFAAHGYLVLYPNYRGSGSYGREFANLAHHNHPGQEHEDIIGGLDALIGRGLVDPKRMFLVGGSAGGDLTGWTIGHTTRFAAAAMWYPPVNWTSHVLTAWGGASSMKGMFPGYPWRFSEHYQARSLLSVVDNVRTPTLIVSGDLDFITPGSEALQYFTALKILDVDTLLVQMPGAPHGIELYPSQHAAMMQATLSWFTKYAGDH